MEGFVLSYDTLCGGEFRNETGIIKSPFYPEYYRDSKTCVYEIIQPPNKRIVLTIEDMEIEGSNSECYFDYLEIYDGDSENSTKLATLCGDRESMSDDPYYSTYNYMYLKFTTDSSIGNRGFKANYTTLNRSKLIEIFDKIAKTKKLATSLMLFLSSRMWWIFERGERSNSTAS